MESGCLSFQHYEMGTSEILYILNKQAVNIIHSEKAVRKLEKKNQSSFLFFNNKDGKN